ncbi:hypothetical protein BH10PSE13_BH10PSE13_23590 [soil metagenome]
MRADCSFLAIGHLYGKHGLDRNSGAENPYLMALVAVLSARSTTEPAGPRRRGELSFAGQALVEYQARQARVAGAAPILILVDDISPILTGVVDRLAVDGIQATLIRDLPTLGRMIAVTDRILLIGDGAILPGGVISLLALGEGARLLVLPAGQATRAFERIDGEHHWAGALAVPAPMLLGLIDMLGDWDLALTLLRQAVQEGAARTLCDMAEVYDGHIVVASDQAIADAATQALARGADSNPREGVGGDIDDWLVGRPAALVVPIAIRHGVAPAMPRHLAIGMGVLGLVAIAGGLVLLGCLLCFAALVSDAVAARLDRLLRLATASRPIDRVASVIALLAILATGLLRGGGGALGSAGAIVGVGLLALGPLLQRKGVGVDVPEVLKFAPGTALLLLALGSLLGMLESMAAVCALLAFASHANRLVRVGRGV